MLINCNKCHRDVEPVVTRTKPHQVICTHCSEVIDTVSPFIVRSLVTSKKFAADDKKSFSFFCDIDKEQLPGVLDKSPTGEDIVRCSRCKTQMNVSKFMIVQFKEVAKIK